MVRRRREINAWTPITDELLGIPSLVGGGTRPFHNVGELTPTHRRIDPPAVTHIRPGSS
jgi:hypothetical protein